MQRCEGRMLVVGLLASFAGMTVNVDWAGASPLVQSCERNAFPCDVIELKDADTLVARCELGLDVLTNVTVRVAGVNAPEVRGPERERGLEAKAHAEAWLDAFDRRVRLVDTGKFSFERRVMGVYSPGGGASLADALRSAGFDKDVPP